MYIVHFTFKKQNLQLVKQKNLTMNVQPKQLLLITTVVKNVEYYLPILNFPQLQLLLSEFKVECGLHLSFISVFITTICLFVATIFSNYDLSNPFI